MTRAGLRARWALAPWAALVGAGLLAVAASPASAAVTPTRDAPTVIRLAVDPGKFIPGTQSVPTFFTGEGQVISLPPAGNPVGTGDAAGALVPFPLDDAGFIVMSTGDATQADAPDRPGLFPDSDDGGPGLAERGLPGVASSARDVTVLEIPFMSPSRTQASCVSFDLRFLSEEYPARLASAFNDAFIAELDATTWTASGSTISAPGNFAALPNGQPRDDQVDGLRGHVARRRRPARPTAPRPRRCTRTSPCPPARRTRSTSRSSITATARSTARSSSTISRSRRRTEATAPPADSPRAARGHHGSRRGCDSRHAHADAHGHRDRARRRHGQDLPGPRRGRDSRADAGGHALRRHVVGARGVAGPGPVHGAGHAGRRQGRRRREHASDASRSRGRRRRWPARASSRLPATGTTTASRTTRTAPTAPCRRSPASPSRTRHLGRGLVKYPAGAGAGRPGFVALKGAENVPIGAAARHEQRPRRGHLGGRHQRDSGADGGLLRRPLPGQAADAEEEAQEAEGADHRPGAQGSAAAVAVRAAEGRAVGGA